MPKQNSSNPWSSGVRELINGQQQMRKKKTIEMRMEFRRNWANTLDAERRSPSTEYCYLFGGIENEL